MNSRQAVSPRPYFQPPVLPRRGRFRLTPREPFDTLLPAVRWLARNSASSDEVIVPEGGKHAPVLIATSWQALNRAISEGQQTLLCNCTVVILFAGFYVEANLNHIVEELARSGQMRAFVGNRHPGLQDKLAWFYNEFVARSKAKNLKEFRGRGTGSKMRRRFKGFAKLYRFRNDLSHGVVNASAHSLPEAQRLRQQAKDIAADLFAILRKHGHEVSRDTAYVEAIRR